MLGIIKLLFPLLGGLDTTPKMQTVDIVQYQKRLSSLANNLVYTLGYFYESLDCFISARSHT